jgi:hypothetical protein
MFDLLMAKYPCFVSVTLKMAARIAQQRFLDLLMWNVGVAVASNVNFLHLYFGKICMEFTEEITKTLNGDCDLLQIHLQVTGSFTQSLSCVRTCQVKPRTIVKTSRWRDRMKTIPL